MVHAAVARRILRPPVGRKEGGSILRVHPRHQGRETVFAVAQAIDFAQHTRGLHLPGEMVVLERADAANARRELQALFTRDDLNINK